jgi:CRP/FNR family transcriptional regulator, cyclic AMP receptor protein
MESVKQQSCFDCVLRPDRLFCDLSPDALRAFDAIKNIVPCTRGKVLFDEGQPARGVFVLCEGRVKLSVSSESGRRLILRIAGPGEVLGLSAALSGQPYEVTAETIDNARVAVIRRKDLLRFLRHRPEVCLHAVHLLSQDLHTAYDRVRSVGLGRSRRPRVARLQ